jgi:hypothetical protein
MLLLQQLLLWQPLLLHCSGSAEPGACPMAGWDYVTVDCWLGLLSCCELYSTLI